MRHSVRKWWLDSVRERPSGEEAEEAQRRLRRLNAHTAVQVESDRLDADAGDGLGGPWRVDLPYLEEAHHNQYGRPWALGKCMFEFLVESGLRPEHALLDFGCGALRLGIWAIPYLDEGNYFGIDSHLESLEAAATYEIPFHDLEAKRPRLLWSQDFAFAHFETSFDWVLDFSSSQKVHPSQLPLLFGNLVEALAPGGRLLTAPRLSAPLESYSEWGLTLVRGEVEQDCALLRGQDFPSTTTWWEFVRA